MWGGGGGGGGRVGLRNRDLGSWAPPGAKMP